MRWAFLRSSGSDGACLRNDPRGAGIRVASSRRKLVSGRSVWILTMMRSCASPVKLRGGGPILTVGILPCQLSVPATSDRQSAVRPERQRKHRVSKEMLFRSLSACPTPGSGSCPCDVFAAVAVAEGAGARWAAWCQAVQVLVLRVTERLSAVRGRLPPCQCALLLKPQKAPGELDHAAADPGIARLWPGHSSRRFAPLSSGEPVRPA